MFGYFSKETMEAELYSIAMDMAMFNPPRELGAGILHLENFVVRHTAQMTWEAIICKSPSLLELEITWDYS